MRTCWILSLALIGFGCSQTASTPEVPRDEERLTAYVPVPIRGGTGTNDAADVVEFAHARITRAYDILAARWSCYMPMGGDTLWFDSVWPDANVRPPLPEPGGPIDPYAREWPRFETNQEDFDFLGVDVDLSPDQRSIVVVSKFGYVPGLMRVVGWVREKLKP